MRLQQITALGLEERDLSADIVGLSRQFLHPDALKSTSVPHFC